MLSSLPPFLFPSIITGQMDGMLSLSSYNGLLHHCVPAHDKAISVLRWYGNKIISGGYDNAVKVHCVSASGHSLVCVNSVHVHEGNITAVTVVEVSVEWRERGGGSGRREGEGGGGDEERKEEEETGMKREEG